MIDVMSPGPRRPRSWPRVLASPPDQEWGLDDPGIGEVVVSTEELRRRIEELGARITADYEGRPPLLVGVLKGAFVFMSDLARAIQLPVEFDFMAVAS